eukprot:Blabericola_migrator_1__7619@NODE_3894_length_1443_cov_236_776890_g2406_i0_p1_GENE_NODE_3894_length_1443_cov_236_776890_g2406_i0NODE_3894_length_1443_cov_236_776890_g2406_i0_p1_ORF_typecomplete_len146_score9_76Kelch_3/PF13415_6/2_6e11Kelch_3/PF13415_6/0_00035Kelch_4/PF13418_6/0_00069Kelch_4/PF13418_6/8_5e08Kelch_4/PF13418_6/6_1e02Kelch_6/PF13964_6/9_1e06Kelch_6/PF13964_6/0_014Kelch_6/PF13964_6/3_5e03Kelch_5/PF13854_6/1_5Kelch_5/PF13854_6/0_0011Kelch_5/PF13854_6/52Kelch_2/PF07646_15/0_00031Kelch_
MGRFVVFALLACAPITGLKFSPINKSSLASLPLAREAAYTSLDQHIYRFGGWNDTHPLISELYRIDTKKETWTLVHTQGDAPSGRYGATLSVLGRFGLLLFGGQGTSLMNDIHLLDLKENLWVWGGHSSIPARAFHTASTNGGRD